METLDFWTVFSSRLPPGSHGSCPLGPDTGRPVGIACKTSGGTENCPEATSAVQTNQVVAVVPWRPPLREVIVLMPAITAKSCSVSPPDHCATNGRLRSTVGTF